MEKKDQNKAKSSGSGYMDKSIILFFLGAILISASVFAFRYINYTPCNIVDFETTADAYRVGEIIRFKDKTQGAVQREWDFGDSSKISKSASPSHYYEKPGMYIIRLKVNGKCETFQKLTIKEKQFILDSTRIAKFDIPDFIKVGEELKPLDKTKDATSWEWRFGETADVNSFDKNPSYTFRAPGLKTVSLIVNGDPRYGTKKKITVLPKEKPVDRVERNVTRDRDERQVVIPIAPPEEFIIPDQPEEKKEELAPMISIKGFKAKLILVSEKKASAKDFKKYLCDNLNLPIIVNKRRTTFIEFCEKIKGKGIKIKDLEIDRKENNCITNITVKYSKTSLF